MGADVALVARARGLAARLLRRERLERLAQAPDVATLCRDLESGGGGLEPIAEPRDARAIDRAATRSAAAVLLTLYRWAQPRPHVLDVFAAHEDRRSLRALLRGAAAGTAPDARLAALLPTPLLPQARLAVLARQPSPAAVVRQLVACGYPGAADLLPIAEQRAEGLLTLELALLRAFEERARRAAARGDGPLRRFVEDAIASSAGQHDALLEAGGESTGIAHAERSFLETALARLTRAARVQPLSTAPVLRALLLVEAQTRDLRTIAWGAALGAPAALRRQWLVTPS